MFLAENARLTRSRSSGRALHACSAIHRLQHTGPCFASRRSWVRPPLAPSIKVLQMDGFRCGAPLAIWANGPFVGPTPVAQVPLVCLGNGEGALPDGLAWNDLPSDLEGPVQARGSQQLPRPRGKRQPRAGPQRRVSEGAAVALAACSGWPYPSSMGTDVPGGAGERHVLVEAAAAAAAVVFLVSDRPTTRFVKQGDLRIAYQVVGDGPLDLVFPPGVPLLLGRIATPKCAAVSLHDCMGQWTVAGHRDGITGS
jgi:hypothetical protein